MRWTSIPNWILARCIARSRCNVSSALAVFLTRAFMTMDNKSNVHRKENRDVTLYRTLQVRYSMTGADPPAHGGNCVDVFGCFYVYNIRANYGRY